MMELEQLVLVENKYTRVKMAYVLSCQTAEQRMSVFVTGPNSHNTVQHLITIVAAC